MIALAGTADEQGNRICFPCWVVGREEALQMRDKMENTKHKQRKRGEWREMEVEQSFFVVVWSVDSPTD